jgi:hypothetical protein
MMRTGIPNVSSSMSSLFFFHPLGRRLVCRPNDFFYFGEISPNFDLKNMISTYTKDFSREKKTPKFAKFAKKKSKSKSPDFYNKFQ